MLKKFLILILILSTLISLSDMAFAQVQESDISIRLTPTQPKANQNVKAEVSSFVINPKDSYFVWKINNDIKLTGIGRDVFSFTLGELNSSTELNVDITTKDGQTIQKIIRLSSSELDLIWEATNSYTPPFYKGKTLFAREGEVRVVAIPGIYVGGGKINPNTLSYSWTKDNNRQLKDSGFGKNYFVYNNSFLHDFNSIEVSVSDINKEVEVAGRINIVPVTPKLSFYKRDLGGIDLSKAINNDYFVDKDGININVVPYYFSPKNLASQNLEIDWLVNGRSARGNPIKEILNVAPEEGTSGTATIKVIINNVTTLFQELERSIRINF